jgi:short-subunit dehydrogenase
MLSHSSKNVYVVQFTCMFSSASIRVMAGTKDTRVLITGAEGGIGNALLEKLRKEGVHILAVGYNKQALDGFQEEYGADSDLFHAFSADLSNRTNIDKLHNDVLHEVSAVDWIIHTAGFIDENEPKHAFHEETVKKTFAVNTFGVMWLTELFSEVVTKGVITISSTAGIWGNRDYPIYSASKAAVTNYGRSLARTFEERDLSSIIICPGPTNTKMRERIATDAKDHQSPDVIASLISSIMAGESEYKNGDTIIARDGDHKLHQAL